MKNKVLRLAIVAVLVIAMVLSMAACEPKVPEVSATPGPGTSTSPTTPPTTSPTKTPEQGTDEALLQQKYGITFPVPEGMVFVYKDTTGTDAAPIINHEVKDKDGKVVDFGLQAPEYNDAFNAYKDYMTITAKVSALTKEGVKITLEATDMGTAGSPGMENMQRVVPRAAGTYTVTFTVKVNYATEDTFGMFKPAKVSETYTVVKTYEVAKKKITIESLSDTAVKSTKLEFAPATTSYGGLNPKDVTAVDGVTPSKEVAQIKNELKLEGEGAKYSLSANILDVNTTAYGAYPMVLKCTTGTKEEVVDVSTLTAPNYEVTFKNGSRYVLTDAEIAAYLAATDDVSEAAKVGAKKEDIALGLATYNALSPAAKTQFDTIDADDDKTADNQENIVKMFVNQENLDRLALVSEAEKLAKVWNDKLQNTEDLKAFITYMVSLGTTKVQSNVPGNSDAALSDYEYVYGALKTKATNLDAPVAYLGQILAALDAHRAKLVKDFATELAAFELAADTGMGAATFARKEIEDLVKQLAKTQAKYDAVLADQKETKYADLKTIDSSLPTIVTAPDTFKLKEMMAKANEFTKEASARFEAYDTLIADLDAYTDVEKATKSGMTSLLGYDFDQKGVNNRTPERHSASQIMFNIAGSDSEQKAGNYISFSTPKLFLEDVTAAFKKYVDAYVALDAAIVQAQVELLGNLGGKLEDAGDPDKKVYFFAGTSPATGTNYFKWSGTPAKNTMLIYQALQKHLGEQILNGVYTAEIADIADTSNVDEYVAASHFPTLEKKELAEIIASVLKTPVGDMKTFITDWNGNRGDVAGETEDDDSIVEPA